MCWRRQSCTPTTPRSRCWRRQGAIQIDAFTGVDNGLAVQLQMVGELRRQDMRQQARAGDAALNRPAWRRRLHDGVAAGARQLGAHMTDHAEAGRHELQLFRHVLAQRPQAATTGRTGIGRRRIDVLVARQMIGQRPAHRLLARGLVGRRHLARRNLAICSLRCSISTARVFSCSRKPSTTSSWASSSAFKAAMSFGRSAGLSMRQVYAHPATFTRPTLVSRSVPAAASLCLRAASTAAPASTPPNRCWPAAR